MAGNKGISRRQQRNGRTRKERWAVHFQTVRTGGFEESQVICYLWDLVKDMETERQTCFQKTGMQEDGELQEPGKLEKQIRSRVRVEMRRYFFEAKT